MVSNVIRSRGKTWKENHFISMWVSVTQRCVCVPCMFISQNHLWGASCAWGCTGLEARDVGTPRNCKEVVWLEHSVQGDQWQSIRKYVGSKNVNSWTKTECGISIPQIKKNGHHVAHLRFFYFVLQIQVLSVQGKECLLRSQEDLGSNSGSTSD